MSQSLQHDENLIDFLSLRLFPHKMTIRAKAELLEGEKLNAALSYIRAIDEFEAELAQLSDSALIALVKDEKESDAEQEKERAEEEENNRFFHDLSARADYLEWTQPEQWTVDQATALLLGKNPDIVNWDNINPLVYKSKFAKRYSDLRAQLKDAQECGRIHASRSPAAFLHYAKSAGFALPAELEAFLTPGPAAAEEAASEPETGDQEKPDGVSEFQKLLQMNRERISESEPEPVEPTNPVEATEPVEPPVAAERSVGAETGDTAQSERDLLLKMLGAIAIGCYGLTPGSDDALAAARMVDDLHKGGFPIDPAGAQKLIADAARLVIATQTRYQ